MCDHTIGYLHDWVTVSNAWELLEAEACGWNSYNKTMNSLTRNNEKLLKEDYKPSDFLDGRKGHMNMLKFCPSCGEKVNWKEIKKAVKQEPRSTQV